MKRLIAVLLMFVTSLNAGIAWSEEGGPPPAARGGITANDFWVGIIAPGSPGSTGVISVDDRAAPSPYTYTWLPFDARGLAPVDPVCDAGFGQPGRPMTLVVRDMAGSIVNIEGRCVGVDASGRAVPPALPQVPSIADIWRAAMRDISPPSIGINPRPTGLTGLETWLWYEGPRQLAVSAAIGPWIVTGTATLREVTFDMGEGNAVTAEDPGSAANPAARYMYERKGAYDVAVTARWEADLVLSGPGIPALATPIGTAVLRSSERYPVQEVRGLLVEE